MASGSIVQTAERLKGHFLAGCQPLQASKASLLLPVFICQPSSRFATSWGSPPKKLQCSIGNGANEGQFRSSAYLRRIRRQQWRNLHYSGRGRKESTLVRANGGDFDLDDGDYDGDGGGMDDDTLGDDIDMEYDGPEDQDADAFADDDEDDAGDDDFELEDFEVLDPETIDVEELDEMVSAEGMGDTSKVRRVPYKIEEDHYLKLQCRKPPFDFYIRKNEDGFLNLSQIYGGEPYSERYVIPSMIGEFPNEFHRYQTLSWHAISTRDYDDSEYAQRHTMSGDKTLRWYLCRLFEDRDLMSDPQSCLMTEHVWKFDAKTRSVEKVSVKMDVTMGQDRVRKNEVLVIRPDEVIAQDEWKVETPSAILEKERRRKARLKIESYLQVFRDYNWEGLRPIWEENLRDPSKVLVSPELIQQLIDEGRLRDTPQLWAQLKLERPKGWVPRSSKVVLPTQKFKRK